MRRIIVCLISLIFASAVGCTSNPTPDTAVPKERAAEFAKKVRDAMTEPSLMQLDQGQTADTGLRGLRQREAAFPMMLELLECGKAAEEPLWELINDADESVRRSSVILVGRTRVTRDLKPIAPQTLVELSIPLLERALTSKDSQVRYFACAGLGDFATWSDECLERLKLSIPKIRELQNDGDQEVRNLGWIASITISAALSARAKQPEDREKAARELEQLQLEKSW